MQLRCFYSFAGCAGAVFLVSAAASPGRAQQRVQQSVQQAEQESVRHAVQEAEQPAATPNVIGTVSLDDATVTGQASTANNRATLVWNGTVTAKDHVAYVELARGGSVRVCATSGLHLTAGVAPANARSVAAVDPVSAPQSSAIDSVVALPQAPLMLSLDRGALEVRMNAGPSDLLMTPDMRIEFSESGALDLRVRVTRNGDTCVENRVAGLSQHPSLKAASLFGDDSYNILPGQHVLFERGSLREVVDNESSPCGCPEAAAAPASESTVVALKPGEKMTGAQAAAQHPFPAAVSQGLAPPPESSQGTPASTRVQVATVVRYSEAQPATTQAAADPDAANAASAPQAPATLVTSPQSSAQARNKRGFFRSIGRFFKKMF